LIRPLGRDANGFARLATVKHLRRLWFADVLAVVWPPLRLVGDAPDEADKAESELFDGCELSRQAALE
jgi:hypothetical protein